MTNILASFLSFHLSVFFFFGRSFRIFLIREVMLAMSLIVELQSEVSLPSFRSWIHFPITTKMKMVEPQAQIVTLRTLLKPIQHLLCFINHIAIALYDNDFVKCLKSRLFFSTSMFTDMVNEIFSDSVVSILEAQ